MQTEEVVIKLTDLVPNPKNPRQIKKKSFENLKKSVKQDKWMLGIDRIVIDENNVILSGHQRVKALIANGETEMKVCRVSNLTEEEKERVLLRSNISDGEWDDDILSTWWDAEDLAELGLDVIGKEEEVEEEGEVEFSEVLDEEHNYICLYFDNDVDWLQAQSLFDIKPVMCGSTRKDEVITGSMKRIGIGRVLNGSEALNKLLGELGKDED